MLGSFTGPVQVFDMLIFNPLPLLGFTWWYPSWPVAFPAWLGTTASRTWRPDRSHLPQAWKPPKLTHSCRVC